MNNKLVAALLGLGFVWSGGNAHAYIYNEGMCSFGAVSLWNVGSTLSVDFTAGATMSAPGTSSVPVDFYLSTTNSVTSSSIFLKRSYQATITSPGPRCSAMAHDTLSLPATTNGSCFALGNYYVIARAGTSSQLATLHSVQAPGHPSFASFSPQTAPVGGLVTLTGTNFDSQTAVYFNGVSAARSIVNATTLVAQVPSGATTGKIRVAKAGSTTTFCNLPQTSGTNFTVDPYCLSSASYNSYGAIDYVASSEFTNNTIGLGTCPNYTHNTQYVVSATAGQVGKQIDIQFGSCGQPNYLKLFKMYVDWNGDNDFTDPGEFLIDAPSVSSDVLYTITLSIPTTVLPGTKRMRFIAAVHDDAGTNPSSVSSCGTYNFGETEDYLLNIAPAPAFSPAALSSEMPHAELTVSRGEESPPVRFGADSAAPAPRFTLPGQP
ncbi:GEVED domain-containing protein [Melittangium boletus]|uniref:Uncharacterized protein n=1 Tax=Melittangium boletus DSM 14713 TaxID=1294270 RepID=A0A250IDF1_9BACT|nr:GEVED domain-containing protein [Melittangium boletus]ATB29263.1 hypothetical protein MEBOL_002712 [Melittangium boletus DSM 14713]